MDFVPQPEDSKRFMSYKWIKWNMYRYPQIFLILIPIPYLFYRIGVFTVSTTRDMNDGKYVPDVIKNRYAICRPGDHAEVNTPKRYKN